MQPSSKELDKFYTSPEAAGTFLTNISNILNVDSFDRIIEPSAGNGELLRALAKTNPTYPWSKVEALDLMPEHKAIRQCDFFDYEFPSGSNLLLSNPPFGNKSKLAIEFFNKAAKHCDAIAMIIPVTWSKHYIQCQLDDGWHLVFDERLPEKSFTLEGKPYAVRCTQQMWVKGELNVLGSNLRKTEPEEAIHDHFTFVGKLDDWDFCMSSSPAIVRSKEYFIEKKGQFCRHFIKAHIPNLEETFNSIAWQSSEGKRLLSGSRFPVADKADVVRVYEAFLRKEIPMKKVDWRVHKERAKVRKKHVYSS